MKILEEVEGWFWKSLKLTVTWWDTSIDTFNQKIKSIERELWNS